MSEFATGWLEWIRPYFLEYGFWFVLVMLFLKNISFLSPLVPGAMALAAIGWFGRQGEGSIPLLALAAFIGTIAGGSVSYYIGRAAGERLLKSPKWGGKIAPISERVRNEPALIIFCHFENILLILVPPTAGLSGVPFRRWFFLNAVGAALWVIGFIAAGYFLSLSQALATGQTIGLVILGLVIVIIVGRYFWGKRQRERMKDEG